MMPYACAVACCQFVVNMQMSITVGIHFVYLYMKTGALVARVQGVIVHCLISSSAHYATIPTPCTSTCICPHGTVFPPVCELKVPPCAPHPPWWVFGAQRGFPQRCAHRVLCPVCGRRITQLALQFDFWRKGDMCNWCVPSFPGHPYQVISHKTAHMFIHMFFDNGGLGHADGIACVHTGTRGNRAPFAASFGVIVSS